jgi:serine/threonine-protein kinase
MRFQEGDTIGGRFQVLNTLGQGGVGIVYAVLDKNRGEEVALKILRPEVAKNRLALERFMREVKAVRAIDHPAVVQVYETGRIGEMLFYTMERVRGESIQKRIEREKRLDLDTATALMLDICDAMERVHEVVIHRDLSSDNILVQPDESIRILDFGTARITSQESDLTAVGLHLGKICYSAPEQRADSKTVDHRADLYSLGVLFYEMLTGELVMTYEPITQRRSDLPPAFDAFFQKALADNPEGRFRSVTEMRAAILDIV